MFSPDLFSDSEVHFVNSSRENSLLVRELVESQYAQLGTVCGKVAQSGAQEINSRNFRLQAGSELFVLKNIPRANCDLEEKRAQAREVNRLAERGLPIPEILQAGSGHELVVEYEASYWCLMKFAEGSHFSGRNTELQSAGNVLIELFTALAGSPETGNHLRTIETPADSDLDLLAKVLGKKQSWPEKLGRSNVALLESNWARLERDINAVVLNRQKLMASKGICHIDLHPHNFLMRNGSVAAILDFESLFVAPLDVMALFGLFKLGRQAVVVDPGGLDSGRVQRMIKTILSDLNNEGIVASANSEDVILRAKAEIIRRILIILKLSIKEGVSDWNHVLPVQLRALNEVEVLFGGL